MLSLLTALAGAAMLAAIREVITFDDAPAQQSLDRVDDRIKESGETSRKTSKEVAREAQRAAKATQDAYQRALARTTKAHEKTAAAAERASRRASAAAEREAKKQTLAAERAGTAAERAAKKASDAAEREAKKATDAAEREAKKQTAALEREGANQERAQKSRFDRLRSLAASAFAYIAIQRTSRYIVELNASMERYAATLTTVMGRAKAMDALDWARKLAATTPYTLDQIIQATVRLSAYGIDAQKVLGTLGDTASAMGKDVMDAVEALADAQTGEFERLKEFGLKVVQEGGRDMLLFTDRFGREQKALIDRNNRDIVTSTLLAIWNERYAGAMRDRMATWDGMMSNMLDAVAEGARMISGGMFDELKLDLQELLLRVQEMQVDGSLAAWGARAAEVLRDLYRAASTALRLLTEYGPTLARLVLVMGTFRAVSAASALVMGSLRGASLLGATAMALLTGNTTRAAAAMRMLGVATRSNPIGLIAGLVSSAAAAFMLFRSRADDATAALRDQNAELQRLATNLTKVGGRELYWRKQRAEQLALGGIGMPMGQTPGTLGEGRQYLQQQVTLYKAYTSGQVAPPPGASMEKMRGQLAQYEEQLRNVAAAEASVLAIQREGARYASYDLAAMEDELAALKDLKRELTEVEAARKEDLEATVASLQAKLDGGKGGSGGGASGDTKAQAEQAAKVYEQLSQAALLAAASSAEHRAALQNALKAAEELAELEANRAGIVAKQGQAEYDRLLRHYEERGWAAQAAVDQEVKSVALLKDAWAGYVQMVEENIAAEGGANPGLDGLGAMDRMNAALGSYRDRLTELHGLRERMKIGEEEYSRAVADASADAMLALEPVYAQLEALGLLTPELKQKLIEAFAEIRSKGESAASALEKGAEKAKSSTEELAETLNGTANALRSIARLGDIFGGVSDEVGDLIGGTADLLDNLGSLFAMAEKAGGLGKLLSTTSGAASAAVPMIGAAVAAIGIGASTYQAIIGGQREAAAQRRQRIEEAREQARQTQEALRETSTAMRDALDEFTGREYTDEERRASVGEFKDKRRQVDEYRNGLWDELDFLYRDSIAERDKLDSSLDREKWLALNEQAEQYKAERDREAGPVYGTEVQAEFVEMIEELKKSVPGFEQLGTESLERLQALIDDGMSPIEAIDRVLSEGLGAIIDKIFAEGNYSRPGEGGGETPANRPATVEDIVSAMNRRERLEGTSGKALFDSFLSDIGKVEAALPPEFYQQLAHAFNWDPSTQEGQDRLKAFVESMAGTFKGDADVDQILEALLAFAEGGVPGSGAGSADSTGVSRSITEVQAVAVTALLEQLAFWAKRQVELLQQLLGAGLPPKGPGVISEVPMGGALYAGMPEFQAIQAVASGIVARQDAAAGMATGLYESGAGATGSGLSVSIGDVTVGGGTSRAQYNADVDRALIEIERRLKIAYPGARRF